MRRVDASPGSNPGRAGGATANALKAVVASGFEETDDDDAHTDVPALKKHQKKASATKNDPVDSKCAP